MSRYNLFLTVHRCNSKRKHWYFHPQSRCCSFFLSSPRCAGFLYRRWSRDKTLFNSQTDNVRIVFIIMRRTRVTVRSRWRPARRQIPHLSDASAIRTNILWCAFFLLLSSSYLYIVVSQILFTDKWREDDVGVDIVVSLFPRVFVNEEWHERLRTGAGWKKQQVT